MSITRRKGCRSSPARAAGSAPRSRARCTREAFASGSRRAAATTSGSTAPSRAPCDVRDPDAPRGARDGDGRALRRHRHRRRQRRRRRVRAVPRPAAGAARGDDRRQREGHALRRPRRRSRTCSRAARATSSRSPRRRAGAGSRSRRSTARRSSRRSASRARSTTSCASTASAARTSAPAASRPTSPWGAAARPTCPSCRDDDRRGRGRGRPVRPHAAAQPPHPRDGLPADDGAVMGVDATRSAGASSPRRTSTTSCSPGAEAPTEVDLIAVASRDAGRAEAYARERGIERSYGSYEELLADPEVEAVYISLPNSMHVEWSIRALDAGKHVLCEKPLSRHPDEVEAGVRRSGQEPAHPDGSLHVSAQPADQAARRARRGRCDRAPPPRPRSLQLLARRYDERASERRARGRRAHGRRLLLRLGVEAAGGRARGRLRPAGGRVHRRRRALRRDTALPRRRPFRDRLRSRPAGPRRARSDRRGGLDLPRRPLAQPVAGARAAARRGDGARSSSSPKTRTACSSRT